MIIDDIPAPECQQEQRHPKQTSPPCPVEQLATLAKQKIELVEFVENLPCEVGNRLENEVVLSDSSIHNQLVNVSSLYLCICCEHFVSQSVSHDYRFQRWIEKVWTPCQTCRTSHPGMHPPMIVIIILDIFCDILVFLKRKLLPVASD